MNKTMEANKQEILVNDLSPKLVLAEFFRVHSVEGVRGRLFCVLRAWAHCPVGHRSGVSDEDIALFFDQLIGLVAAASQLHQADRVAVDLQEGQGDG